MNVPVFGAMGAIAMPLLSAFIPMARGATPGPQFASGAALGWWIVGLGGVGLVGALVAFVMEKAPPLLRAMMLGLSLPAALTALAGGDTTYKISAASTLISSAWAQGQPAPAEKAKAPLAIPDKLIVNAHQFACDNDCKLLFYGKNGDVVAVAPVKADEDKNRAVLVNVPASANSVALITPGGNATPTALSGNFSKGTASVGLTQKSSFAVGFGAAFGFRVAPFSTKLSPGETNTVKGDGD